MDTFVDYRDFELLARDQYTFAVLDRILRGRCDLVLTDHRSLIICHSEAPYPVWMWTPDGCPEDVKETAWALAAAHRPLTAGYRFNLKYELADHFIRKAGEAGLRAGYSQQLYAYDCPSPMAPERPTDGEMHVCTEKDIQEAARLMGCFYTDIGEEPVPLQRRLEKARAYIERQAFFLWKNAAGETVACCSYQCNQGTGCVGSVYTLPEHRRNHYAQHLVYRVTKSLGDMGYLPILYTDANYPASNACYEKIGYILRGKLCTVGLIS